MFKRIKDLRIDHDLTQEQIAKVLKINRVVYSRYETGVRQIPSDLLKALAKYYNVSADYILELSNDKRIH